jgi:hypothetical protein
MPARPVCVYLKHGRPIECSAEQGGWFEIGIIVQCSDVQRCICAQFVPHPVPFDHGKRWERARDQTFPISDDCPH